MKLTTAVARTRFFIYPCKYGTAETSGKWRDGRKSPYQATAIKNTEERQKISEAAITKWMLVSEIF